MTDDQAPRTAIPLPGELPFEGLFRQVEEQGRILRREDIYTSGDPVDMVSEEIVEFAAANTGPSILDVGCGLGPYVERLSGMGRTCVGVDTDAAIVARARELGRDVREMSAYGLEFEDASFDSVIMVETLEHLDQPEAALEEAFRVATRSVVVTVPDISVLPLMSTRHLAPWHMLEGTHLNFFTPALLKKTLLRYASRCEVITLGRFFEIDGKPLHTHLAAAAFRE
jgi:ubiquinone/menaquinone biosynthesis C-methylase UbiE